MVQKLKVIYDESIKFNEIKTIKSYDSDILDRAFLNISAFVNNADAIIRKSAVKCYDYVWFG